MTDITQILHNLAIEKNETWMKKKIEALELIVKFAEDAGADEADDTKEAVEVLSLMIHEMKK